MKIPTLYDLSHPIVSGPNCTFSVVDTKPRPTFEEGDSHGMFFITSRIDNLHSNVATHIDFPGHLDGTASGAVSSIGEYPVERFIGRTLVLDVSHKLEAIRRFFRENGEVNIEPRDEHNWLAFFESLESLEVDREELEELIQGSGELTPDTKGLLFHTGLGSFWQNKQFDSWRYIYFWGPYLSTASCDFIVKNKLSFVGVDAFQLEHPIINFRGDELPLVLNEKCRDLVRRLLNYLTGRANHNDLLGNDIFIYENLSLPEAINGHVVDFYGPPLNIQLVGVNDNGLARPVAVLKELGKE
jgi:kynurenine formamidase